MFWSNILPIFPLQHEWISHHGRNVASTEENLSLHMFVILERLQILNISHHKNFVNSLKRMLRYIFNIKISFWGSNSQYSGTEYLSGERCISLVLWGTKEATKRHFCHLFLGPILSFLKILGWCWCTHHRDHAWISALLDPSWKTAILIKN